MALDLNFKYVSAPTVFWSCPIMNTFSLRHVSTHSCRHARILLCSVSVLNAYRFEFRVGIGSGYWFRWISLCIQLLPYIVDVLVVLRDLLRSCSCVKDGGGKGGFRFYRDMILETGKPTIRTKLPANHFVQNLAPIFCLTF